MENLQILQDNKPAVEEAIELYAQMGLGNKEDYNYERYEKAFQNSSFITARVNDNLVGMVRVISDQSHETSVREFLVKPDCQKKGVGKAMLEKLFDLYGHTDLYINTPDECEEFFLKNGMNPQKSLAQVSRKGR